MATLQEQALKPDTWPNCWQCQHFGLTYQITLPYKCDMIGLISKRLPSVEVLNHDGRPCYGFLAKTS